MIHSIRFITLITALFILFQTHLHAEETQTKDEENQNKKDEDKHFFAGEWYISWGYNKDYWQPSDIHVVQKALNNDFTVHNVHAVDSPEWDSGNSIFTLDFSVPEWNLRIGRYIDAKRNYALELNFDHTKYTSVIGQNAHITGTISGLNVDIYQQLTSTYFNYKLHNGANHFMINLLRRFSLLGEVNQNYSLNAVLKVGAGFMFPHAENTIFGNDNDVGNKAFGNWVGLKSGWWQLNGLTTGIEAGLQFVFYKPFFLEFSFKEGKRHIQPILRVKNNWIKSREKLFIPIPWQERSVIRFFGFI